MPTYPTLLLKLKRSRKSRAGKELRMPNIVDGLLKC